MAAAVVSVPSESIMPIVHTALNIPSIATEPSVRSMQWSDDGQLFIVTRGAIYILTPDLGINFDTQTVIRAPLSLDNEKTSLGQRLRRAAEPYCIGWYRTVIDFDRASCRQWSSISQEWSTVSFGVMDPAWLAVSCSPSNLTPSAGCYVVALNTNLEASLWRPGKDFLKGEWSKVQDITDHLLELPPPPAEDSEHMSETIGGARIALRSQIHCIAWSAQVPWDPSTADNAFTKSRILDLDGSLLAVGNRAGCVLLMHLENSANPPTLHLATSFGVASTWIVHVSWTFWSAVQDGASTYCAWLACGAADGSIALVRVSQRVVPSVDSLTTRAPAHSNSLRIETNAEESDLCPCESDGRGITALQWVDIPSRLHPILVFCKPGLLHLWSQPLHSDSSVEQNANFTEWTGLKTIRIQAPQQKLSSGISTLTSITGIAYAQHRDSLLLAFADGRVQLINDVSTDPVYVPDDDGDLPIAPSMDLTFNSDEKGSDLIGGDPVTHNELPSELAARLAPAETARNIFVHAELAARRVKVKRSDVNRISGLKTYNGLDVFVWLQESTQPNDFSYKSETNLASTLIVASLLPPRSHALVVGHIRDILFEVPPGSKGTPLSLLRPVFWHLREQAGLATIHADVQALLRIGAADDFQNSMDVDSTASVPPMLASSSETPPPGLAVATQALRHSLKHRLFHCANLFSLRLRLALSDHCWKLTAGDDARQAEYGAIAQGLHSAISWRNLEAILQCLTAFLAAPGLLAVEDVAFMTRIIVQCMLPGSPDSLRDGATRSLERLQATCGERDLAPTTLEERCPACSSLIPLADLITATCPNGHIWVRCSITSVILSTPMVRTCVGCTRKALLPPTQTLSSASGRPQVLPEAACCRVVEELLTACSRCLFCGNAFTRIL